ncbi:hypothetical protein TNCV_1111851 [Trichonephila clavipes]|nr:hypothetical protein TNCV_1111851 [Trichonephila clavipes]
MHCHKVKLVEALGNNALPYHKIGMFQQGHDVSTSDEQRSGPTGQCNDRHGTVPSLEQLMDYIKSHGLH